MGEDDLRPPPHFRSVDEERLGVARDRAMLERLKGRVTHMTKEITERAGRLAERDAINGYAKMLREVLGQTR